MESFQEEPTGTGEEQLPAATRYAVMKWMAIVSGVAVVIASIINPSFTIAGIGPIGIGIMTALMGTLKNYQPLVRDDQYHEIDRLHAEDIAVWRKRRLIGLRFTWHNEDGTHYFVYSKVYCRGYNFEEVLDFIRQELPDAPHREAKFRVHSHFARLS